MAFPTNLVLIALSLVGVGSLAYLLFTKDNEDEVITVKSSKHLEIEIKVPNDCVPMVIGRQGSKIKELESTCGVKINFNDRTDNAEFRICRVRGPEEAARLAESSIHAVIANQPLIESYDLIVPNHCCGRIIGKNGDTIRNISFSSNAKITVSRGETLPGNKRTVTIKGTAEQIAAARSLINDKVNEEIEYKSRMEQSVGARSPRHGPKYLLSGPANSETNTSPEKEKLVPTGSDGLLEVYASAVESPDRIWLQVIGPSTNELDRLNDTMTEYYAKHENRIIHALTEVAVDQLVAAPFMYDKKFYRAQVTDVNKSGEGMEGTTLGLYYVDYGDSGVAPLSETFALRTDYLKLRFQAIECILARVKPRDDEKWSEEATDLLEVLTQVALWKPLTAKIHGYRDRPTRAKREGSPVPCVNLYDTSGLTEIDVARELVEKGFAVWDLTSGVDENGDCKGNGKITPATSAIFTPAGAEDESEEEN